MKNANYNSREKALVRSMIHQAFMDAGCKSVLFFPSSYRYELDALLSAGFAVENLIAVESHPQCKSNFTRRLSASEAKHLRNIGALASEAGRQLMSMGVQIDAANLDFCTSVRRAAAEITAFVKSGVLRRGALLAVQVFAGHDKGNDFLKRALEVKQAIEKGLLSGQRCERLSVVDSWYKNEKSRCSMSYSVWRIQ